MPRQRRRSASFANGSQSSAPRNARRAGTPRALPGSPGEQFGFGLWTARSGSGMHYERTVPLAATDALDVVDVDLYWIIRHRGRGVGWSFASGENERMTTSRLRSRLSSPKPRPGRTPTRRSSPIARAGAPEHPDSPRVPPGLAYRRTAATRTCKSARLRGHGDGRSRNPAWLLSRRTSHPAPVNLTTALAGTERRAGPRPSSCLSAVAAAESGPVATPCCLGRSVSASAARGSVLGPCTGDSGAGGPAARPAPGTRRPAFAFAFAFARVSSPRPAHRGCLCP